LIAKIHSNPMFEVQPYLDRIEYSGPVVPALETLKELQYRHLMAVPFENLDIHYGNPIHLDIEAFYRKIVLNRRGGFCYELNGLFYALLEKLEFDVRIISGGVYEEDNGEFSPEYDHMALLVEIDGETWLVDVGFGEFVRIPLNIDTTEEQVDNNRIYRVRPWDDGSYLAVERRDDGDGWSPEYKFRPVERKLDEFQKRCRFHQTSKASHFTRKKICSLPTENGRITLTGKKLMIREGEKTTEKPVANRHEFEQYLASYFGITIR